MNKICTFAFLFISLYMFSESVWALGCVRTDGNGLQLSESIGSTVKVPSTVPDYTIIWRGPERRIAAHCFRDNYIRELEHISFYVNPDDLNALAWGIEFGMRVNGVDQWPQGGGEDAGIDTGAIIPACDPSIALTDCPSVDFYVTFQPIIRKRGLNPFSQAPDSVYPLYQLDGKYGLNGGRANFTYSITDLDLITATDCTIDVTVTPSPGVVDFGTVQKSPTGFSPTVPKQYFSLILDKNGCETPITINGFITTPNFNGDYLLPDQDSGFGIKITELKNNTQVPIAKPFFLSDFTALEIQHELQYSAELVPLGDIKVGPFSAVATIEILYL
ncbi:fimbrial protein [Yersinia frederiksenii]|uniref:fimbrial protein n=1 Tax=Yersinia frederiksenii TaxID=29484 RepID=UPI0005E8A4C3|nr:fimbrial protein [Yersinia frederiksenii]CQJ04964.1 fimbrial protein [Yersinia frederiksenii]